MVQGQSEQMAYETPISKITKAKWTGGMLKQYRTYFVSAKPQVQIPVPPKRRKKEVLKKHLYTYLLISIIQKSQRVETPKSPSTDE
jgi:hypothetical protein